MALYTRGGLIEAIGTAHALAMTANKASEYVQWAQREVDLRGTAWPISPAEEEEISNWIARKMEWYTNINVHEEPI